MRLVPVVLRVERAAVPPVLRAVPLLAVDARDFDVPLLAPADRLAGFFAVERFAVPVERDLVERDAVELRPDALRDGPLDEPLSSSVHLPESTRCAASATASAISEPSRVALETATLAAFDAVSAASMPASRILRRAVGLAAIAAAAAVRPAASISRLIAALAILSTVLWVERELELAFEVEDLDDAAFEDDDFDPDEDFRLLDFAICKPPLGRG